MEAKYMPRRPYDPLAMIPRPEAIRQRLTQTLTLAERLRVLLDLSEKLNLPLTTGDTLTAPTGDTRAEGGRA